ncbi:hypothetical protein V1511DRAFT_511633 [Dipodascopsis uninucleata]
MSQHHRRGPWSASEDARLLYLIQTQGPSNWVRISQLLGTRTAKQCRERYHQNLKPTLNHSPISPEEGELIESLVAAIGKKWAEIARHLAGRSDNAVKNWWNGGANRRRRQSEPIPHDSRTPPADDGSTNPSSSAAPYSAGLSPASTSRLQLIDRSSPGSATVTPVTPINHLSLSSPNARGGIYRSASTRCSSSAGAGSTYMTHHSLESISSQGLPRFTPSIQLPPASNLLNPISFRNGCSGSSSASITSASSPSESTHSVSPTITATSLSNPVTPVSNPRSLYYSRYSPPPQTVPTSTSMSYPAIDRLSLDSNSHYRHPSNPSPQPQSSDQQHNHHQWNGMCYSHVDQHSSHTPVSTESSTRYDPTKVSVSTMTSMSPATKTVAATVSDGSPVQASGAVDQRMDIRRLLW